MGVDKQVNVLFNLLGCCLELPCPGGPAKLSLPSYNSRGYSILPAIGRTFPSVPIWTELHTPTHYSPLNGTQLIWTNHTHLHTHLSHTRTQGTVLDCYLLSSMDLTAWFPLKRIHSTSSSSSWRTCQLSLSFELWTINLGYLHDIFWKVLYCFKGIARFCVCVLTIWLIIVWLWIQYNLLRVIELVFGGFLLLVYVCSKGSWLSNILLLDWFKWPVKLKAILLSGAQHIWIFW